jgi:uracil phosphoribosyltransferase
MERTECRKLAVAFATVAIVRAGMSMIDAVVNLLPSVSVGFVGMERDEETAEARSYYCKLPPLGGKRVLLVDPMLATGGSALQALDLIYGNGAGEVSFLNIVAAPEGVRKIEESFPDVAIYTAALDRELNSRNYILPGLGDFGDRLYGT